jgi:hypothetical protein
VDDLAGCSDRQDVCAHVVEVAHDQRGPVVQAGGEGFAPRCELVLQRDFERHSDWRLLWEASAGTKGEPSLTYRLRPVGLPLEPKSRYKSRPIAVRIAVIAGTVREIADSEDLCLFLNYFFYSTLDFRPM